METNAPVTVILMGPQGCGKGLMAHEILQRYGMSQIVDEWRPGAPLTPGAVHVTNALPAAMGVQLHPVVNIDSRADAAQIQAMVAKAMAAAGRGLPVVPDAAPVPFWSWLTACLRGR